MRRLLPLVLVLLAAPAFAQQATLNTPVTRTSKDNYRVESYYLARDGGTGRWQVDLSVRDSGGTEIERLSFSGPDAAHPSATGAAFNTATSHTVITGPNPPAETGSNARKTDYRIIVFLRAQGYICPASTCTLVP